MLRLFRVYEHAPNIAPAQSTAAGTLPAAAFQYCEAMRIASSYGWYVHPPRDLIFCYDGSETWYSEDGEWYPIKSVSFGEEFREWWNERCPEALLDCDPPFLSELFVPGHIQIWSGYFAATDEDWGLLIRPPVNSGRRTSLKVFEGFVESDKFSPFPLFINIQLLKTDCEIFIPADRPLFQIQPLPVSVMRNSSLPVEMIDEFRDDEKQMDWKGLQQTIRRVEDRDTRRPGKYAARSRQEERRTRSKG